MKTYFVIEKLDYRCSYTDLLHAAISNHALPTFSKQTVPVKNTVLFEITIKFTLKKTTNQTPRIVLYKSYEMQ